MSETNIKFNVKATLSDWFLDQRIPPDTRLIDQEKGNEYAFNLSIQQKFKKLPKYRIYVNDDLIVERDWIWDNNIYIEGDIWVDCELEQDCVVRLEPITFTNLTKVFTTEKIAVENNCCQFDIEKFQISNGKGLVQYPNNLQVNFRVDKYINTNTQLESQE